MLCVGENRYFIDMGTSALDELITRNIPIDSVKGVFISHMHGDHIHGLIPFIDTADWFYKVYSIKYLLPWQEGVEVLKNWIKVNRYGFDGWFLPFKADIDAYSEGVIFDDGIVKVTAKLNRHIANSYSFLVEAEGKRLIYTGDLKSPEIDFPTEFIEKKVDLAICEGVHFPTERYCEVLKNASIEKLCIIHYDLAKSEVIKESLKDYNLSLATDSMVIEV